VERQLAAVLALGVALDPQETEEAEQAGCGRRYDDDHHRDAQGREAGLS
jgi:hypothetical protein